MRGDRARKRKRLSPDSLLKLSEVAIEIGWSQQKTNLFLEKNNLIRVCEGEKRILWSDVQDMWKLVLETDGSDASDTKKSHKTPLRRFKRTDKF